MVEERNMKQKEKKKKKKSRREEDNTFKAPHVRAAPLLMENHHVHHQRA